MTVKNRLSLIGCILLTLLLFSCNSASSPFPEDTKRVLFLGNSISYAGGYINDMEAYYIIHYPDKEYVFMNLGLPSETVSGLSEEGHAGGDFSRPCLFSRLDTLLSQTKPDVVFACYGMNDGIYAPFNEDYFQKYKDGIEKLYSTLEDAGVKQIYLLTPPIHVDAAKGLEGYNLVLDKYSEWLISQKKERGWDVIDLHFPMKNYLEDKRKLDSSFSLAGDGIHPNTEGHWVMAREILKHLGEKVDSIPDVESALSIHPYGMQILEQVQKRNTYMRDAWLSSVGHNHPYIKGGISMVEAEKLAQKISDEIKGLKNKQVRIACVGNSITEGYGVKYMDLDAYPSLLQDMLGHDHYKVLNFGSLGTTLMDTNMSYMKSPAYERFLNSEPDIVAIKLGTNDSSIRFRERISDEFIEQYKKLVESIKAMPSQPQIIILLPTTSYMDDYRKQIDEVIVKEIIPRIRQVAEEEGLEIIDIHSLTENREDLFPDGLHPKEEGMRIIADALYKSIKEKG